MAGAKSPSKVAKPTPDEIAARAHEIQTGLGMTEVPELDNLRAVGMAVKLALHIQGLPALNYDTWSASRRFKVPGGRSRSRSLACAAFNSSISSATLVYDR
jgi:hypothetical protein